MTKFARKQPGALPWSYSKLNAFETCARRFYLTTIKKVVVEKQSPQLAEGQAVHKALEKYVGFGEQLPPAYAKYKPMADKIKTTPGQKLVEYKFGVTQDLKPTGFWDNDVWLRGALDVSVVKPDLAVILDYKTGKRKLDSEQLKLFAAAGFVHFPHAKKIKTGFVWLPDNKIDIETFEREQAVPIFREFAIRVERMVKAEQNDDWPPTPGGLCREWCPVGRALCEFCGS